MDELIGKDKIMCEGYFMAHSNSLEDSQRRIKEIEDTIKSLPHEVKVIQEAINKMSDSMDKLLERLEEKYVSKELYENSMAALLTSFTEYKANKDKEVQQISSRQDWIMRGLVAVVLYVIRDVALILINH